MYGCLRYGPIRLWAAVGSVAPTSGTTTGSRGRAELDLPRGQHAARHDGDVAGSGNGGLCRHGFPGAGALDGGGRVVQSLGAEDSGLRRSPRRRGASASRRHRAAALPAPAGARARAASTGSCRATSASRALAVLFRRHGDRRHRHRRPRHDRRLGGHRVVGPRHRAGQDHRPERDLGGRRPRRASASASSRRWSPSMSRPRETRVEALPWVEQATLKKLYPTRSSRHRRARALRALAARRRRSR